MHVVGSDDADLQQLEKPAIQPPPQLVRKPVSGPEALSPGTSILQYGV